MRLNSTGVVAGRTGVLSLLVGVEHSRTAAEGEKETGSQKLEEHRDYKKYQDSRKAQEQ